MDLDPVISQLRKSTASHSKVPQEVEQVLNFLEATRADSQTTASAMEELARRLDSMKLELESMRFNTSELVARLQHTNSMLSAQHLTEQMEEAARQVAGDMQGLVGAYAAHVNHSMSAEISSCAPLVDIARHSKAAVCDYALDPFVSSSLVFYACS